MWPAPARPKIGLVLSGGGAMGMAHVGAIQTLEKLGIRPDLVVGTSMGSIVGGLYSSGMSGPELEHAIETMDWDLIFDTSPPREGLTYREKQLQAAFPAGDERVSTCYGQGPAAIAKLLAHDGARALGASPRRLCSAIVPSPTDAIMR